MKKYVKSYFRVINESIENYGNYFGLAVSLMCLLLGLLYPETLNKNAYYGLFAGLALLFAWRIHSSNRGDLFTVIIVYLIGELMIYAVAFDTTISNVDVIYNRLPDTISSISSIIWWSIIVSGFLGYLDAFENPEEEQ